MPQQIIYEQALAGSDSISIFDRALHDERSIPESKAYAACGLWEEKKVGKIKLKAYFKELNVTFLLGDILKQESLGTLLENIISNGCR